MTDKSDNTNHHHQTKNLVFSSLTNPVLVYVKILMTLFLILIHLKLKFFSDKVFETDTTNNDLNSSNKTDEKYLKNKNQEEIVFYTECCLLITLIVYMISKIFKTDDSDFTIPKNTLINQTRIFYSTKKHLTLKQRIIKSSYIKNQLYFKR